MYEILYMYEYEIDNLLYNLEISTINNPFFKDLQSFCTKEMIEHAGEHWDFIQNYS